MAYEDQNDKGAGYTQLYENLELEDEEEEARASEIIDQLLEEHIPEGSELDGGHRRILENAIAFHYGTAFEQLYRDGEIDDEFYDLDVEERMDILKEETGSIEPLI